MRARAKLLESLIRKAGKDVVTIAEEIAGAERKMVRNLAGPASLQPDCFHRRPDFLLVIAIGQVLSRMVARPLKHMEESMEAVANGRRDQIDIPSDDREIISLTHAFNHVLQRTGIAAEAAGAFGKAGLAGHLAVRRGP